MSEQQGQLKQFQIGQVIFVLSNQNPQKAKQIVILPGIVLEEILSRRLDGNSVSYKVAIGPANNQKVVDISRVDGEIYGSIEEVRAEILGRISDYVNNICGEAETKAAAWYGLPQQGQVGNTSSGDKLDPATLMSEVSQHHQQPQGMLPAMHHMQPPPQYSHVPAAPTHVRNRMADPELLQRDVVMEDGSIQKVSINTNPKQ